MLNSVARASQALAIWRIAETGVTNETDNRADLKGAVVQAHQQFLQAAYDVAFELVPLLLKHGEVVAKTTVRYSATPANGGFVLQAMSEDDPGMPLNPNSHVERILQLMVDLTELLEILGVE